MTVTRDYGVLVFECDSCNEILETESLDFTEAYAQAKREGWKAVKVAGEWFHRCPDCLEDEE